MTELSWYLSKKDLLLFDSFEFTGFKQFIVDNDKNIIDKMLFNFKKFNKKDTKINLVSLTFSLLTLNLIKKIKWKSLDNLANTTKYFFHLLTEFGKLKKQKTKWKLFCWMINFKNLQQTHIEYFSYIFIRICLILLETAK